MKKNTIRIANLLVFSGVVVVAGCQDRARPKAKTEHSSPPSVGREYGETLRGAIDKAHGAKSTFEASSRALEETDDAGK
jgi:hypothetical protein